MKHDGDLIITKKNAHEYGALTSVGGDLYVGADFTAPLLASVGGNLYVGADFTAPLLASVGGNLNVGADFTAPLLASVGGYLDIRADFTAPLLASVGGNLDIRADFTAPELPVLPSGDIGGWKKCSDGVVVHLRIPAEAKRIGRPGNKCRAEFADVIEVIGSEMARSSRGGVYRAGERVYPDSFNESLTTCSNGIHFFMTRKEAEDYT